MVIVPSCLNSAFFQTPLDQSVAPWSQGPEESAQLHYQQALFQTVKVVRTLMINDFLLQVALCC